MDFYQELKNIFNVLIKEPLSHHTTWQTGGNAKYFVESTSQSELCSLVALCHKYKEPFFIIGRGANLLISDDGFNGLVIKNTSENIRFNDQITDAFQFESISPRRTENKDGNNYFAFDDLNEDETHLQRKIINADSGYNLSIVFQKALLQGLTGLQWYSGIPASVGGAVYNNIHGGKHFLSDVVMGINIIDEDLNIKYISNKDLAFAYDYSILHDSPRPILSVDFALFIGNTNIAQDVWNQWAIRKKSQPRNSAGSTWQNISDLQMKKANLTSNSVGYILDQILHLKGLRVGNAFVSINGNPNFIETTKGATSNDVLEVMRITKKIVYEKLGIVLKPEIFFVGFDKNPLES